MAPAMVILTTLNGGVGAGEIEFGCVLHLRPWVHL